MFTLKLPVGGAGSVSTQPSHGLGAKTPVDAVNAR